MDVAQSGGVDSVAATDGSETRVDVADHTATARLTTRPVVDLLSVLQQTLALVDLRAMNLTAILLASLIALWTQLHAFASGAPAGLAWAAWILVVIALLVKARVILPHRLVKLGDGVLGWTKLPCRFEPDEEATVLAQASSAFRDELIWLRRHMLISTALGIVALVEVVIAYVIQKV
jgi:hypothetical protein